MEAMEEEVEYVVPPDQFIPEAPRSIIQPRKKPNAILGWFKSHKVLFISSVAMSGLLLAVVIVMATGQRVTIFGVQLNPLHNSASTCSPVECPENFSSVKINQAATLVPAPEPASAPDSESNPAVVPMADPANDEKVQLSCSDPVTASKLTPIFQFWSENAGDHLYTTDSSEKPAEYEFQGIVGYLYNEQVPGTTAIYRSAQKQIGSHYYNAQKEDPAQYGYVAEGVIGYAYTEPVSWSVPWFRLHMGGEISDIFHTTREAEKQKALQNGYSDKGIVAYICSSAI